MDRPHGTQDRISADAARRAAQRRARRAASLARRGAAARRRGVLTLALLTMSAVGWVAVGLTTLAVVAAVVPTVALAGVLVLGRRAVVQGLAADAAWEHQRLAAGGAGRTATVPVTGRALHPSDAPTQTMARITDPILTDAAGGAAGSADDTAGSTGADLADDGAAGAQADADAPGSAEWSPVPVPRPTYTTKAAAPRREPIPLVISEPEETPASAVELSQGLAADLAGTAEVEAEEARPAEAGAPTLAEGSTTLDLDAILARRRAAG